MKAKCYYCSKPATANIKPMFWLLTNTGCLSRNVCADHLEQILYPSSILLATQDPAFRVVDLEETQ